MDITIRRFIRIIIAFYNLTDPNFDGPQYRRCPIFEPLSAPSNSRANICRRIPLPGDRLSPTTQKIATTALRKITVRCVERGGTLISRIFKGWVHLTHFNIWIRNLVAFCAKSSFYANTSGRNKLPSKSTHVG